MIMRSGDFGPQLKAYLISKKIKQADIARKARITESSLTQMIKGRRDPSLDTLLRILQHLDTTLENIYSAKREDTVL